MQDGTEDRPVVELDAVPRLAKEQAATAHVASADEVHREPQALAEDVREHVDVLRRRDAAEEHDVADGPIAAASARALPRAAGGSVRCRRRRRRRKRPQRRGVTGVSGSLSPAVGVMTCTPPPTTGWSGSGGRANRRAYASLPRKYSPLTKENTSPSAAPSRRPELRRERRTRIAATGSAPRAVRRSGRATAGRSRLLESPAQQHRANREPGANRREQHETPLLQRPGTDGVIERQRNRGRRGVAEALDIDDDLLRVDAELFGWPTG